LGYRKKEKEYAKKGRVSKNYLSIYNYSKKTGISLIRANSIE